MTKYIVVRNPLPKGVVDEQNEQEVQETVKELMAQFPDREVVVLNSYLPIEFID